MLLALILTFLACKKDDDLQKAAATGNDKLLTLQFDLTTTTQIQNPDKLTDDVDLAFGMPIRTREKVRLEVFENATSNMVIEALEPEEPIFDLTTGNFIPADDNTITKTVIQNNRITMYNKAAQILYQGPDEMYFKELVQSLKETRDSLGVDNLNAILQFFNPKMFKGKLQELARNPAKYGAKQIDLGSSGQLDLRTGHSLVALEMNGHELGSENTGDKASIFIDTTKNVLLASTFYDQTNNQESTNMYFYGQLDGSEALEIKSLVSISDEVLPSGAKVKVEQIRNFDEMNFEFH